MSEHGHAVQVAADEPAAAVVENGDAVQEPAAAADVGGVVEHVHAVLEPAPAAGDAAATQAEDPNLVRSVYLATIAHPQSVTLPPPPADPAVGDPAQHLLLFGFLRLPWRPQVASMARGLLPRRPNAAAFAARLDRTLGRSRPE